MSKHISYYNVHRSAGNFYIEKEKKLKRLSASYLTSNAHPATEFRFEDPEMPDNFYALNTLEMIALLKSKPNQADNYSDYEIQKEG